jgi:2-polyprenyl-3-methyl-5-hydroxy-6-metoxy-1,4-benzoquinol methylase
MKNLKSEKEFYDEIFSIDENHWRRDLFKTIDDHLIDIIVENYDSKYHKTFLEVGCGDGRFFDTTYEKLKELKLKLNGIDFSSNAIDAAKRKEQKIPVKFICDEYLGWLKEQEEFDIIYSNGVFEHYENIELALEQTKNILSSNGFFLMSVPNNLGYDINKNDQTESFCELNGGSHQIEWHLFLESWETIIDKVGFDKTFIRGFDERIGFIWILKRRKI